MAKIKAKGINEQKKQKVKELSEELNNASSVVYVDYSGMNVSVQEAFRNRLREVGGSMLIAKNSMVKLAGEKSGFPEKALDDELLQGQTALVLSGEDSISPIQSLGKFAKEFELPKIKAGIVEGVFQNEKGVLKITNLPSKEELSAQAVGAVAAPMYATVGVLQANLQNLISIFNEYKNKQQSS